MLTSEFQAVIMAAGKGSRITELTARKPKCLLPVGNLPMIWYPINLLENSWFQEVIIVVSDAVKNEVQMVLERFSFKIRIDLAGVTVPPGEDWGTADTLRYLQDGKKIKSDVLILSCDLISNINLEPLLDTYRKHNAAMAALFVKSMTSQNFMTTPGPKTKDKMERDFVGIDPVTSRLVFIGSSSDYEEILPVSRKILQRYGKICLHTRLLDAHVYIFSNWICQYLCHNRSINTLKGELIPHIVKRHMTNFRRQRFEQDKASIIDIDTKPGVDIIQHAQESELTTKIRFLSTYTDRRCHSVYNNDLIRCYANLVEDTQGYAVRCNTLQHYWRVNREIMQRWAELTNNKELINIAPSSNIKSTQLDRETCMVGEKSQILEKTSIKGSLIGPNVVINSKTRVINSLLMSGVKIGEGCNIQNCIVCEEAVVEDNCELKDCLVGSQYIVSSSGKHSNEVLTDVDHLMEI